MTLRVDAAAAADLIEGHDRVTVLCHVRPDADAIGSAAALTLALRARGVAAVPSFDPGDVPRRLATIPGAELVVPIDEVPAHDGLVVTVDCASLDRVGGAGRVLDAASAVLVVDHHRSNPGFGTHLLLDPDAASTTTVLLELFEAGGWGIDAETATALYAGLVTDTGSFRWGGAAAHDTARRLLEAGARAEESAAELLDARDFRWLGVLADLLGTADLDPAAAGGRGVVWLAVPHAELTAIGADEVESLVGFLRGIREAAVGVLLKEYEPGSWAVSMRSRDGVDVGAVATSLGGGGHTAAAGATLAGDLDEVTGRVRDALG